MKTPGVYIEELDAFGNAVVPVATAVPAFIGYTEKASFNGRDLTGEAVKVTSFAQYASLFGGTPPAVQFSITEVGGDAPADSGNAADKSKGDDTPAAADTPTPTPDFTVGGKGYTLAPSTVNYRMYSSMKFFFENGGGHCYVVSVGQYDFTKTGLTSSDPFMAALTTLKKEHEPTMIVIPEAVEILNPIGTDLATKYENCYSLQSAMLDHCGELQNRVAIIDVPAAFAAPNPTSNPVEAFRDAVEPTLPKFNSYGAAYYPYLNTTVNQLNDVSYKNIAQASQSVVTTMLTEEFTVNGTVNPKMQGYISALFATPSDADDSNASDKSGDSTPAAKTISPDKADSVLKNLSKSYQQVLGHVLLKLNLMPPSSAMAGIYTTVDNNEGVWVAPANVAVQSVVAPAFKIDSDTQQDLNVPVDGKSICAIRAFTGKGTLVWGARTLDGNSNDWRYMNVRRTLIYIEQSVKDAAEAYVFAPNVASTWVNVESMIASFLTDVWKQGGLAGDKATDAFSVSVGLGSTMTAEDILAGKMIVAVKVAVSHPAEFIEITFEQEMQK